MTETEKKQLETLWAENRAFIASFAKMEAEVIRLKERIEMLEAAKQRKPRASKYADPAEKPQAKKIIYNMCTRSYSRNSSFSNAFNYDGKCYAVSGEMCMELPLDYDAGTELSCNGPADKDYQKNIIEKAVKPVFNLPEHQKIEAINYTLSELKDRRKFIKAKAKEESRKYDPKFKLDAENTIEYDMYVNLDYLINILTVNGEGKLYMCINRLIEGKHCINLVIEHETGRKSLLMGIRP